MNYLYAINFAPGFEELVASLLEKAGAKLKVSEEGFALVESSKRMVAGEIGFAKSLIEVFSYGKSIPELDLRLPDGFVAPEGYRFSIRSFEGNRPSKLDSETRVEVIKEVSLNTRLKYSAFEPDVDFIISKRRNGLCFFGMKLPTEKLKSEKGELHPDVVNLLCELGDIKRGGRILDAFAGYGGVTKEVARSFHPQSVIMVEKSSKLVNSLKPKFKGDKSVSVVAAEVVGYLSRSRESFDLIMADIPWGEYEGESANSDNSELNLLELYSSFLENSSRRLAEKGKVVIMSSKKEELEAAAEKSGLKIEVKLNVLISGKKVLVLKLSLVSNISHKLDQCLRN